MLGATVAELREQAAAAAGDPNLTDGERRAKLRAIRQDMTDAAVEADRMLVDAQRLQEAGAAVRADDHLFARSTSGLREALLEEGVDEDWLDEALPGPEQIKQLREEGLLEAIVGDIRRAWEEAKHPRGRGGKFSSVGHMPEPKEPKLPKLPEPPKPKLPTVGVPEPPKPPSVPKPPEQPHVPTPKLEQPLTPIEKQLLDGGIVDEKMIAEVQARGLNLPREQRKALSPLAGEILGAAKDTRDLHRDPVTSKYSPERKQLHDKWVDLFLREKKPVYNPENGRVEWQPDPEGAYVRKPEELAAHAEQQVQKLSTRTDEEGVAMHKAWQGVADQLAQSEGKPRLLMLAGGNASGKSTALYDPSNTMFQKPGPHNVEVNFDLIKEQMPEFQKFAAAHDIYGTDGTHFESADVARRLVEEARSKGLHVIIDASGDSSTNHFQSQIGDFKGKGYGTDVLMVDGKFDVAVKGMIDRAGKTGRYVPLPIMDRVHRNSVARHIEWRDDPNVDRWRLYHRDENGMKLVAEKGDFTAPSAPEGKPNPPTAEPGKANPPSEGFRIVDKAGYAAVLGKAPGGGTAPDIGRTA